MQAEATESSLREGIESLDVKDAGRTAPEQEEDGEEEEESTDRRDVEMTDATEEDSSAKGEKSNQIWRDIIFLWQFCVKENE